MTTLEQAIKALRVWDEEEHPEDLRIERIYTTPKLCFRAMSNGGFLISIEQYDCVISDLELNEPTLENVAPWVMREIEEWKAIP